MILHLSNNFSLFFHNMDFSVSVMIFECYHLYISSYSRLPHIKDSTSIPFLIQCLQTSDILLYLCNTISSIQTLLLYQPIMK